jgi:hypothetical protein
VFLFHSARGRCSWNVRLSRRARRVAEDPCEALTNLLGTNVGCKRIRACHQDDKSINGKPVSSSCTRHK